MCIIIWSDLSTSSFVLGVVGHGPHSLDSKDLAQFLNNATGKASTSVTQEACQGSKDRDVASM